MPFITKSHCCTPCAALCHTVQYGNSGGCESVEDENVEDGKDDKDDDNDDGDDDDDDYDDDTDNICL